MAMPRLPPSARGTLSAFVPGACVQLTLSLTTIPVPYPLSVSLSLTREWCICYILTVQKQLYFSACDRVVVLDQIAGSVHLHPTIAITALLAHPFPCGVNSKHFPLHL